MSFAHSRDDSPFITAPMTLLTGTIAVVDDDLFVLRALERAIAAYGYRVKAFASAEEYLRHVQAGDVACAVVDIDLGPGLSGLQLGEVISQAPNATPIVYMSGSADWTVRERARAAGCVEFLEKPFMTSQLVAAIMSLEVGE